MNKEVDGRAGRPASNEAARHGTGEADLTVMLAAHDAFRRDLRKLATAASQARSAGSGDRSLPAAADAADELATQLSRHLTHEERDALPLIGQALTAREWRDAGRTMGRQAGVGVSFVPEFFGWLLDGAAPDKRAAVLATLPAVMRPLVANVFRPLYARRDSW